MGFLYGCAGRLTAQNGGFRPGQYEPEPEPAAAAPAAAPVVVAAARGPGAGMVAAARTGAAVGTGRRRGGGLTVERRGPTAEQVPPTAYRVAQRPTQ
jgi:hypothetical protein